MIGQHQGHARGDDAGREHGRHGPPLVVLGADVQGTGLYVIAWQTCQAFEQWPQAIGAGTGLEIAALFGQFHELTLQAEAHQIAFGQVSETMLRREAIDAFGQGRRGIDTQAGAMRQNPGQKQPQHYKKPAPRPAIP